MRSEVTSVQKSQEVSALLAVPNSHIIAGGTTFSAESDQGSHYIDISGLEGLNGIKQKGSRIEIGPLTTLDTLSSSMLIRAQLPALAECAANVNPEVRNQGTIGGNIASERIGDTAAALLASGAKLTIKTDSDYREILIDRFWSVDGRNDLAYDEWITKISLSVSQDPFRGAAFGKLGKWDQSHDPFAAAAIQLSLNEKDTVTAVRGGIRLGTNNIRRMFPLEKALKNRPLTNENMEKAARAMIPALLEYMTETEGSVFLMNILERCISIAQERRAI